MTTSWLLMIICAIGYSIADETKEIEWVIIWCTGLILNVLYKIYELLKEAQERKV